MIKIKSLFNNSKIYIGDQGSPDFLIKISNEIGIIDILIDDGGHQFYQQINSFKYLFKNISDGGIYVIEDTHTSYDNYSNLYPANNVFNGGKNKSNTTVEFFKNLCDEVTAWAYTKEHGVCPTYKSNCDNWVDFINKYERLCIQILETLLPLPYDKKVKKVLEMASTWDNYSLSVIYLKYMYYFNVKGFVKNSFIIFFTKLLTQNIHPTYLQRHSIEGTIHSYDSFWYDEAIHKASNFVEILANLEKTALQMRNVVLQDIKKERKLKRLITLS